MDAGLDEDQTELAVTVLPANYVTMKPPSRNQRQAIPNTFGSISIKSATPTQ